ncbi:hypothetical protein AVEN_87332-1 [Araneus ventricosus]|uniref:Uncharacterized protein n=1 Tax=Araneus ventricosus TaxID=182803 RepID=A0A4Y2HE02_ARAVE|nr:hypothetical protein AVEN_87332-1 [Araneus ventricosus]
MAILFMNQSVPFLRTKETTWDKERDKTQKKGTEERQSGIGKSRLKVRQRRMEAADRKNATKAIEESLLDPSPCAARTSSSLAWMKSTILRGRYAFQNGDMSHGEI